MAYVRRRGKQLVIVRGERDPGTGKVEQQILFTLYSKAEAKEAAGGDSNGRYRFQSLLGRQYPDVKFDWKKINRAVMDNLEVLPDEYEYRAERLRGRFRQDLGALIRQLILCDPQFLVSAASVIQEHHHELEYLSDLIKWRLQLKDQKENEWNTDNRFFWRFALQGNQLPPDAEEHAASLYERGEYGRAAAVFRLLIDCFDNYADGHNYLGLIALHERRLDEAIAHFEKTIEVGRRLFPKRLGKKHYWSDLSTRPYMRGLRNLALTLIESGRFADALTISTRLEEECGDGETAEWDRAVIFLNTGRYREAADTAGRQRSRCPDASLIMAFAFFEIGERQGAMTAFLHGALNHPRATRMLIGDRTTSPKGYDEVEDHNAGVSLLRSVPGYLTHQSRASKRFFRELAHDPRVVRLLDEVILVAQRWHEEHASGKREAFDRMNLMRSTEFARAEVAKLGDLVEESRSVH